VRALDQEALLRALDTHSYAHGAPTPAGVDVELASDEEAVALIVGLVGDGVPLIS
jgi:hypothetical protein